MAVITTAQRAALSAEVLRYAPGAPAELVAVAADLVIAHVQALPATEKAVRFADQDVEYWAPGQMAAVIRMSGAAALLASWRRPRARAIEAAS